MSTDITRRLLPFTLLLAAPVFATDGYFATGYGIIQQGQGGAGVAFPQDSLAAATNPAGMLLVGDRFDFGVTLFRRSVAPQSPGAPSQAWTALMTPAGRRTSSSPNWDSTT